MNGKLILAFIIGSNCTASVLKPLKDLVVSVLYNALGFDVVMVAVVQFVVF
jgi:hypothetical protein